MSFGNKTVLRNVNMDLKMSRKQLLDVIRISLWGNGDIIADEYIYLELERHAILSLPGARLSSLDLSPELSKKWKTKIIQQLSYYTQYKYAQSNLPIQVPYVILKGTTAAQYYPYPEYRTMGDIDIMTRRVDFDTAYQQMLNAGYHVLKTLNREIIFKKNNIVVELHQRFATLNNPEQAKYLDDLIITNINSSHVLPDLINGLVLLEHIDQHLEGGIGLRQIIDWMMFVDKCLPDEKWQEFLPFVQKTNLEKLAIGCTRMCEIYLGLPQRQWCASADVTLCEQLMDYVLYCGNFGNKKISDADISKNVFAYASTPRMLFKLLQKQGLVNWRTAGKYKFLKPFAWIYQAFRYMSRGLKRDQAASKLLEEYNAARKRNAMFDALGVKTTAKGVVVLKNGEYVKE